MPGFAHHPMAHSLVACSRLHTDGAPLTPPGALNRRRHSSATTAATASRSRRAGATCNCANLRAVLRPSVRFRGTADTRPSVRGESKAATAQNVVRKLSFRAL
jgi:hypothetical protein